MRRRAPGKVSLERALSKLGLMSRSVARRAIREGRLRISGRVATDPLAPVVPETLDAELDGVPLEPPAFRCLLLHKPRGVVTTRSDPEGRATVFDRIDGGGHLMPVGRLDWATSGLLLLTNDSRLADWLTDPAHALPRTYVATVRGRVDAEAAARMQRGVVDRGESLRAEQVEVRKASGRESHLTIVVDEGRHRMVRRLCAACGHEVTRLKRVAFGGLDLGALAPGELRDVDLEELRRAFGREWEKGPMAGARRGKA